MKRVIEYSEPVYIIHRVQVEVSDDQINIIEDIVNETDKCSNIDNIFKTIKSKNINISSYDMSKNSTNVINYVDDYDSSLK